MKQRHQKILETLRGLSIEDIKKEIKDIGLSKRIFKDRLEVLFYLFDTKLNTKRKLEETISYYKKRRIYFINDLSSGTDSKLVRELDAHIEYNLEQLRNI